MLTRHQAVQVVFEVKNVKEIENDHFNQLAMYLSDLFGHLGFLVTRLEPSERILTKALSIYNSNQRVILILSDEDLKRMLHIRAHGENPSTLLNKKYVKLTRRS